MCSERMNQEKHYLPASAGHKLEINTVPSSLSQLPQPHAATLIRGLSLLPLQTPSESIANNLVKIDLSVNFKNSTAFSTFKSQQKKLSSSSPADCSDSVTSHNKNAQPPRTCLLKMNSAFCSAIQHSLPHPTRSARFHILPH